MTELIKDSDFNINVPYAWKKRKLKEANEALQALWRIDLQIEHWMKMPDSNIYKRQMLDELYYLRDGKV